MTTAVLVDYIDEHRERFGVEPICTVLREAGMQIAPSSYYAAKTRPPSARAVADVALTPFGGHGVMRLEVLPRCRCSVAVRI